MVGFWVGWRLRGAPGRSRNDFELEIADLKGKLRGREAQTVNLRAMLLAQDAARDSAEDGSKCRSTVDAEDAEVARFMAATATMSPAFSLQSGDIPSRPEAERRIETGGAAGNSRSRLDGFRIASTAGSQVRSRSGS
jgi:hypothetical protein